MGRGEKTDERKSKEEEERWKRRGEKLMSEKENNDNKAEEERWTRRTRGGQQGQEGRKTTGMTIFFSEGLPFAPPPRMKTLPPSWLRHRGPHKGTNDITVQGM